MIGFSIFGAFRTWQIEEATGLSFILEKGVRIIKKSYIVIHARETDCRELGVEGQTTKTV
jgi:hypothetical protein